MINALFDAIQDECLPGIWSKGVSIARASNVHEDSVTKDELRFRVVVQDKPVSPTVSLWPGDVDSFCDCGNKNGICAHIAAAVVAVKNNLVQKPTTNESGTVVKGAPYVRYHFSSQDRALHLKRRVVVDGEEHDLVGTLVSNVAGLQSGRLAGRKILASKEDFSADHVLSGQKLRTLETSAIKSLLKILSENANVFLDGTSVKTSPKALGRHARVTAQGHGFRLLGITDDSPEKVFSNGAALLDGVLRPREEIQLTPEEHSLLGLADGKFFGPKDIPKLVAEILPSLQKKITVEILTERLPELVYIAPHVVLRMEKFSAGSMSVVAELFYGEPPIQQILEDRIEYLNPRQIAVRDLDAERALMRRLQAELHLKPGVPLRLEGLDAVDFARKATGWKTSGTGQSEFVAQEKLAARFVVDADGGFTVRFDGAGGKSAAIADVFQAYRAGYDAVPLIGGGFAKLPADWLSRYGKRLQNLLAARGADEKLPSYLRPTLFALCDETAQPYPDQFKNLKHTLETFEGIPSANLPKDLTATLRSYQKSGIDWLCFLRDNQMGAMLADDMGLGKTLQALCAIRGRTLVVTPTSVLYAWAQQIKEFRPDLNFNVYHGPNRSLDNSPKDSNADSNAVVLTTYAILRLDQEKIMAKTWETIVLDEAQTIKNPDSQVAKTAHALRADFRLALTGTPVENRLEDLWSQFQFLNPGLLGSRAGFQDELIQMNHLKQRLKPFILRRLKRDVTPDLPPRTESILQCELSDDEKNLYGALFAATKAEVLEKLEAGGSVMQALEALLRLRQASCHPALIPGERANTSAKTTLLIDTVSESIALGHRALIFSQWTKYLDLIEPHLNRSGISFSRIDGSTQNRQDIVDAFQKSDGPNCMLISLKAGGTGLTLTAADHIFMMDPWWNPAVEDQAADRAHRIGQKNPVFIHKLISKDTVEERIVELQKKKKDLASAVLSDGDISTRLTREDLLALLS